MSIIIKGMDMPKDLTSITVIMHGLEWDYSQRVYRDNIVEIPTPHGRLIDKDAMPKGETYGELMWEIDHAPTILEAEE